jgi:hypothetical protein
MPVAGIAGVVVAAFLTGWPEYERLAPYVGNASPLDVLRAVDLGVLQAMALGMLAAMLGWALTFQQFRGLRIGPSQFVDGAVTASRRPSRSASGYCVRKLVIDRTAGNAPTF